MGKGSVIRKLTNHIPKENVIQVAFRLLGIDGGPGSGNFGHKGRPGLVGGSGPGGGKQYRGGRADIGYFSSKKDWLNGLSGDKQAEATRLLKSAKSQIPPTSDKTPEEYIMQEWPIEWREHFLKLVGEARSWKDRGANLQMENLDPMEWSYLNRIGESLDDRYADRGETLFTDEELHNSDFDEKYGLMSDEEKELYLDLKAKACGLPTSGKKPEDYSKVFRIEIGDLDKATPPRTLEENREWIKFLDREEKEKLQKSVEEPFGFGDYEFSYDHNMNDLETRMVETTLDKCDENEAEEYISALNEYLTKKDEYVNGEYFKQLTNVSDGGIDNGIGRANYWASHANKEILRLMARGDDANLTIEKDGDILETKLLMDKSIPQDVRAAYLLNKAMALGMSPILERRGTESVILDYVRDVKNAEENRRREEKKAQTVKEYNESKKKNYVVIAGDSFSEEINSMRTESGSYTHEEIAKIGTRVAKELEKVARMNSKKLDDLNVKMKELNEKRDEEAQKLKDQGIFWSDNPQAFRDISDKYEKLIKDLRMERDNLTNQKPIVDILKRVRQIGPSDPGGMKTHLPGRSTVKQYVSDAYNDYPREWVDISMRKGSITTRKVGRGYYSSWADTIAISGFGKGAYETATHELGHRFEDVVPGIADAEGVLYNKRTKGEKEETLRSVTGNKRYRANEKTKKDKFIDPYIGKVYNDNTYEIVSMGFQYAVHDPMKLLQDKEYANFILGLLAVG